MGSLPYFIKKQYSGKHNVLQISLPDEMNFRSKWSKNIVSSIWFWLMFNLLLVCVLAEWFIFLALFWCWNSNRGLVLTYCLSIFLKEILFKRKGTAEGLLKDLALHSSSLVSFLYLFRSACLEDILINYSLGLRLFLFSIWS